MTTPARVLEVARAEIGTTEWPAGSNRQKYGAWYSQRTPGMNGVPWCAIWCAWVMVQAGGPDPRDTLTESFAYTPAVLVAGQRKGIAVPPRSVQPGDWVLYNFPGGESVDHIGYCESVGDGIVAIEGNTSGAGSQSNGGAVMRKARPFSSIAGVVRPPWTGVAPPANTDWAAVRRYCAGLLVPAVASWPTLAKGATHPAVRQLQQALNIVSAAGIPEDSSFGPLTDAKVRAFQGFFKLAADGQVGPQTRSMLAFCLAQVAAGKA